MSTAAVAAAAAGALAPAAGPGAAPTAAAGLPLAPAAAPAAPAAYLEVQEVTTNRYYENDGVTRSKRVHHHFQVQFFFNVMF